MGDKVTIKKPPRTDPNKVMVLEGSGEPGTKVTIVGVGDAMGREPHADVNDQGVWRANAISPRQPGVHTVSVESTAGTSTTTFEVRQP